jgi:hypothetical protein
MGWNLSRLVSAAIASIGDTITNQAPSPDFVHRISSAPLSINEIGSNDRQSTAPRRSPCHRVAADVNCLSSDTLVSLFVCIVRCICLPRLMHFCTPKCTQSECLYAGCGDALVYCIDISTGQTIRTLQGTPLIMYRYCIYFICVWLQVIRVICTALRRALLLGRADCYRETIAVRSFSGVRRNSICIKYRLLP